MTDLRILIIDDSEDDRHFYARTLRVSGTAAYTVVEAEEGEEGLKLAQQGADCILLDYSLPGRNGIEVLKRVRALHPFIPVVMLTGQGNEAVAVSAIQEGAQNYITKSSITPETLSRAVRIAVEHCAMQRRIHEQRASLEIFTRALAHDLKEPVRTIQSFLKLLMGQEKFSEKGAGYFDYVRHAADRMGALIDMVYFYTRLDGSAQAIASEPCDSGAVLKDAMQNLNELIRESGAEITGEGLPQVSANRIHLLQLFQNLLANAIQHGNRPPVIRLAATQASDHWLFRVTDNGPGIAEEERGQIFEPFKRLSSRNGQGQNTHGLGLGLAICRKIVEAQGGKIWYEPESGPEPGRGTTFLFTLPKAGAPAPQAETAPVRVVQAVPEKRGQNRQLANLLLVEDNEADVELARILLLEESHLRCNFLVARDGRQALELLHRQMQQSGPVDFMLLDINMPGMDGFQLLELIRKEEALKRTPVAMCTTSTYDKDMTRAKALGVLGYLNKPARLEDLKPLLDLASNVQLHREGNVYSLLRAVGGISIK